MDLPTAFCQIGHKMRVNFTEILYVDTSFLCPQNIPLLCIANNRESKKERKKKDVGYTKRLIEKKSEIEKEEGGGKKVRD